ncbi:MAG: aminotransferase class I/II-fold pyridoxal phosphate-dependent enzyme [Flavobacteriaceae bacterium]|nr:aminotransferase class I/II-fold pyridoxal phosphate-dependent enzyme [Bacteroidia bacterium]MBT8287615.1 aminotransferase class I/II-fold pyridoxal phosphate-dependent enzyme [Bacteroidia bacterium]NNF75434.1 aminotransferase class I/II-fold pyridoxal phosphate-dependent enzyme [Flavobacteriaceae bacterium]NNK72994.1 aminotransferase class I/II-fold pyridoxal phosphate-dependent enzyme [Flavobacteriaceae bacterium]
MASLNRREWLQLSGLGGIAAALTPFDVLANPHNEEFIVGSISNFAKLNSNENPFGPSKKVRQAMIDGFDMGCRYPYQKMNALAEILAKKEGLTREHIVMCAGSTEGLKAAGLTYGNNRGEIIAADPVYKSLLTYAEQFGAYINRVPLNSEMGHDLEEMERRVTQKTSLVFLCNPNNPTGTLIPKQDLVDFCNTVSEKTVVFSDEAYYDYITDSNYPSMVNLVKAGKNVIVSRTFSKVYGLAGLRVGYLIARPDIAERIRQNVMAKANMMALIGATTALDDDEFYTMSIRKNNEAKTIIYDTLNELGLKYIPSHTNFVFFETGKNINDLIPKMRAKDVAIGRPFPPLTKWCRISTGTIPHMHKFADALKATL